MDEASLELLEHLAGTTAGSLLWIFAYRSGEEGTAERTSRLMKALAAGGLLFSTSISNPSTSVKQES